MPALNTLVKIAVKPLPRVISPNTHAVLDYIMAGSFLAAAAWFWRRNKRAAVAALVCGGERLTVSLLTGYPGRARNLIPFHTRHNIDFGLATTTAIMPNFFGFQDVPQKKFFLVEGVVTTAINELTQFPERRHPERGEESRALRRR